VSDFEGRLATLLKEHVHDGLGPRRPAPPLRDDAPDRQTFDRRSRWWLPVLAAACVASVLVVALAVAHLVRDHGAPAASGIGKWEQVRLPNGGYAERSLSSVGFSDERHGWIVGNLSPQHPGTRPCAVWTTSDGGTTWALHIPHVPNVLTNCVAAFGDATHGWLAANRGSGVSVFATMDAGRTWTHQTTLPGEVSGISAVDRAHAWLYGDAGLFAATTDGTTWSPLSLPDGVTGGRFHFLDPLHGWLGAGRSGTYATIDGGRTWSRLPNPNGRQLGANLDFVSPRVGWADTPRWVLRTADGGKTWQRIRNTRQYAQAIAFSDANHGWIFTNPFLGTTDGGRTWVRHTLKGGILVAAAAGCSTVALTSSTVHHYARCRV
jgi:photosystem II stability/assembly factor-like uncharacterized protein